MRTNKLMGTLDTNFVNLYEDWPKLKIQPRNAHISEIKLQLLKKSWIKSTHSRSFMNSPLAVTYLPAFTRLESQKITALIKSDSTLLVYSIYWEGGGGLATQLLGKGGGGKVFTILYNMMYSRLKSTINHRDSKTYFDTYQGRRILCRMRIWVLVSTNFWHISYPYFNEGGQILPTTCT